MGFPNRNFLIPKLTQVLRNTDNLTYLHLSTFDLPIHLSELVEGSRFHLKRFGYYDSGSTRHFAQSLKEFLSILQPQIQHLDIYIGKTNAGRVLEVNLPHLRTLGCGDEKLLRWGYITRLNWYLAERSPPSLYPAVIALKVPSVPTWTNLSSTFPNIQLLECHTLPVQSVSLSSTGEQRL